MAAIRGTYIDGKIVPDTPPDWPNGLRLVIEATPLPPVRMMTDEEQGDDPESIARWLAVFDALPAAAFSPLDDPAVVSWRETMHRFNIEAVRKQMQEAPE
jgi:hypothetical protein